jgi:drug/metabolite transporter (DMT)-like permease
MLPSLLTTVCFSLSVIFAARSARILGPSLANLARLLLAAGLLAIWAHAFGGGLKGGGLPWFIVSGVIGFGLGDMALFGALSRIGPRLSILLTQCLAAPIGALAEWMWMGTVLTPAEFGCSAVILGGVAIALAPDHGWEGDQRTFWIGTLFGALAAAGQALGAVVSRKAKHARGAFRDAHRRRDRRLPADHRGVGITILAYLLFRECGRARRISTAQSGLAPFRSSLQMPAPDRLWAWPATNGRSVPPRPGRCSRSSPCRPW